MGKILTKKKPQSKWLLDIYSMEPLMKSAQYCTVFYFDAKVIFLSQNIWVVVLASSTVSALQKQERI